MDCSLFINLPVRNVVASSAFYAALGAEWDDRFCDGSTSMMRFADSLAVVLVRRDRFAGPVAREGTMAHTQNRRPLRLNCDDRAAVDRLAAIANWAGGRADPIPSQDCGSIHARGFEDPDGHIWEAVWMDEGVADRETMQLA